MVRLIHNIKRQKAIVTSPRRIVIDFKSELKIVAEIIVLRTSQSNPIKTIMLLGVNKDCYDF